MNQPYSRISENVLFVALLTAAIGYSAVQAATQPVAPTSAPTVVASTGVSSS